MARRQLVLSLAFLVMVLIAILFLLIDLISLSVLAILFAVFSFSLMLVLRKHKKQMIFYMAETQGCREKLNLLSSKLKLKDKLLDNLPHQIERLGFFKTLTDKIIKIKTIEEAYYVIGEEIKSVFKDVDTILIYLHRRGALHLVHSVKNTAHDGDVVKEKKGDLLDFWVAKNNKELLIEDIDQDFRFDKEKITSLSERPIKSLLSSPMFLGRKTIGIIRVESYGNTIFSYDDLRILSAFSDIAALAIDRLSLFQRVEDLAVKDSLTGLYLRGYFNERLKEELNRVSVNNTELSLIMFDIDNFKQINDKYGHIVGDIVIKKLAYILSSEVGKSASLACRFGGEEFILLMPGVGIKQAKIIAENIRLRVEAEPILFRRKKIQYTISAGISSFPTNAKYAKDILQVADDALYKAKKKGRNRVCWV